MPASEAKKKYDMQYAREKLKRIPLDVRKDKYDEIKAAADAMGEPVNGYIKRAIDERIERETMTRDDCTATLSQPKDMPGIPKEKSCTAVSSGIPSFLTPDIISRIDAQRFLSGDASYQLEVADIIGIDNLTYLYDYLKQNESSME